ncbi:MAG: recombinase family protein [Lachnospiraceae bacterium]|nr:recombinase family protein [Lachnospiraceae bacterium]
MKKTAAIYIRVSTDAQFEEGYSVDAQKEQLSAYCISKGIKDYEFYVDGGWSGSNIERPEIQRLIKDVKDDKISHVIVYKLDRLSRSQKDTLYLIEDVFNPHGVDFVSLNESMDTSTPMGKLMLGILSAFAQLERENIRLRTRMGMKERVKSGLWMGGGRIPFGYDYNKNEGILIPNKDAEKVRQIYKLYIEGKAPQEIANLLGLKYDRLVYQILTRKSNYGIIEYNGEEYQGQHEPIISKETYDIAMRCMIDRQAVRANSSEYLLTGLVYCGKCGAKMRYQKWGNKGCKLVCYSQQKSKPYLIKDPDCDQEKIWADEVEDVVIKSIFEFASNYKPSKTESLIQDNTISLLYEQQSNLNKKLKRLYNIYAEDEDDVLLDTINDLKKQIMLINKQIELDTQNSIVTTRRKERTEILSTINELWGSMSAPQKKSIIRKLVNRIDINDNNVHVDFSI